MKESKNKLEKIKDAIKKSHQSYLDFERTKDEFLMWLSQFPIPTGTQNKSWDEYLESFPDPSPDCKKPDTGLKVRFLLKLYINPHRYIFSIVECFDADAAGVGILSVHVNLDQTEYNLQKFIEKNYKNSFDSSIKAKQVICVEPFKVDSFLDSLNHAGLAIFGNEIRSTAQLTKQTTIPHHLTQSVTFPDID